jgi:hypothetical protein
MINKHPAFCIEKRVRANVVVKFKIVDSIQNTVELCWREAKASLKILNCFEKSGVLFKGANDFKTFS